MEAVFLELLNRSIAAGWLILAVILLRLVLKRAPKQFTCCLWALVAVRLVCPFSVESSLSLIPSAETFHAYNVRFETPAADTGIDILSEAVNSFLDTAFAADSGASVNPLYAFVYIAGIVWAAGLAAFLLYAAVSTLLLRRAVRESVPLRENIRVGDKVAAPFILGLFRPCIYLPSGLDAQYSAHVIAHERAHLARHDHWWKALGFLLLAVYWFHPLCWAAYLLLCRDIELACDESVICRMEPAGRKEYSHALVACGARRHAVLLCPLAFGEVGVKERVKRVLKYRKPAFWLILLAAAVCVAAAVCFLTDPEQPSFQLRITVPAGSMDAFVYSDEQICPTGNVVTVSCGQDLGDTTVILTPVSGQADATGGKGTYLTPGMPVKLEVEAGTWYRVGVSMQNPTEEEDVVHVTVTGVEVRIE